MNRLLDRTAKVPTGGIVGGRSEEEANVFRLLGNIGVALL
jgi:hypothetical protein